MRLLLDAQAEDITTTNDLHQREIGINWRKDSVSLVQSLFECTDADDSTMKDDSHQRDTEAGQYFSH